MLNNKPNFVSWFNTIFKGKKYGSTSAKAWKPFRESVLSKTTFLHWFDEFNRGCTGMNLGVIAKDSRFLIDIKTQCIEFLNKKNLFWSEGRVLSQINKNNNVFITLVLFIPKRQHFCSHSRIKSILNWVEGSSNCSKHISCRTGSGECFWKAHGIICIYHQELILNIGIIPTEGWNQEKNEPLNGNRKGCFNSSAKLHELCFQLFPYPPCSADLAFNYYFITDVIRML